MLVEIPLGHLLVFWKDPPVEGERGIEQGRADAIHLFDLYVFHDSHQRRRGGKNPRRWRSPLCHMGRGVGNREGGRGLARRTQPALILVRASKAALATVGSRSSAADSRTVTLRLERGVPGASRGTVGAALPPRPATAPR